MPLHEACARLAFARHQRHRLIIKRCLAIRIAAQHAEHGNRITLILGLSHFVHIGGLTLGAEEFNNPLHLSI